MSSSLLGKRPRSPPAAASAASASAPASPSAPSAAVIRPPSPPSLPLLLAARARRVAALVASASTSLFFASAGGPASYRINAALLSAELIFDASASPARAARAGAGGAEEASDEDEAASASASSSGAESSDAPSSSSSSSSSSSPLPAGGRSRRAPPGPACPPGAVLLALLRGRCRPRFFCPRSHCCLSFQSAAQLRAHQADRPHGCPPLPLVCPRCPARFSSRRHRALHVTLEREFRTEAAGGRRGSGGGGPDARGESDDGEGGEEAASDDGGCSAALRGDRRTALRESRDTACLPVIFCPRGCGGGFLSTSEVQRHLDRFQLTCAPRRFQCATCRRAFASESSLAKHTTEMAAKCKAAAERWGRKTA